MFKGYLSLKRYSKLSEYLHVLDRESEANRGHQNYDKLGKIRWLKEHLRKKFSEVKHPEKPQVIDEQIMPFSGRISYIQYNVSIIPPPTHPKTCQPTQHLQTIPIILHVSTLPPLPHHPQSHPPTTYLNILYLHNLYTPSPSSFFCLSPPLSHHSHPHHPTTHHPTHPPLTSIYFTYRP